MSDGVLSQEEIDALLKSNAFADMAADDTPAPVEELPSGTSDGSYLSDLEKDAIGEVSNIVMGSAANTLSTLLDKKVEISAPVVELTDSEALKQDYPLSYLMVNVEYLRGVVGSSILMIKYTDACIMADLVMGGNGQLPPAKLEDMYLSAVGEAMNQMMGASSTAISTVINEPVEIAPLTLDHIDLASGELQGPLGVKGEPLVKILFRMKIDEVLDSELLQLIPVDLAKGMVRNLMDEMTGLNDDSNVASSSVNEAQVSMPTPEISRHPEPAVPVSQVAAAAEPAIVPQMPEAPVYEVGNNAAPSTSRPLSTVPEVPVQPVQFAPLQQNFNPKEVANIDLIMDVPLQITVELGKTKKTIREILALGPGSVIELDKLAGEPVDLLVNGKLLAKGEVVVIDENFGIRVSDIISPIERVTNLQ